MEKELFYLSDTEFPITIVEHKKDDQDILFEAHSHKNQLQIIYVLDGKCNIYCNKNMYVLEKNDLLLIQPKELHYGIIRSKSIHYYVIRIDLSQLIATSPKVCKEKYLEPIQKGFLFFHHKMKSVPLRELVNECIQVSERKESGYELSLMQVTYKLMELLIHDNLEYHGLDMRTDYLMKKRQRFERVLIYIQGHLADTLTTENLAEMAGMSIGYFCRSFKECTNETPVNYINKQRLEKATMLLNQGKHSITEIAYVCGFHDSNYFSRVFKKYMKQTPSEFLVCARKYRI